jgi:ABC-2 type transport system permease protein
MTGWAMRHLPPGSFAWLVLHELRLATRGKLRKRVSIGGVLGWILLMGWVAIGVAAGYALASTPIEPDVPMRVTVLVVAIIGFTFMTTQALLTSQQTIYEAGDLDLLFSAPVAPRVVVSAKLVGIVAAIAQTYTVLLLPIVVPVAAFGHPELFGIVAVLAAMALLAACLGLALTLIVARIAGPRGARTLGQILAALMGGLIFLITQISNLTRTRSGQSAYARLYEWLTAHGYGSHGWSGLLGDAAFGDLRAILLLLGGAVTVFAVTAWLVNSRFLAAYRAGGMKLSHTRRARGGIAGHFHRRLFGTVFAKEWKLLARDPALVFQVVLRLVYLAPLFVIGLNNPRALGPGLAFMSVVIAGQMVGSLAWLTVSAEDSPDLIKVAPVEKASVDEAKMIAAIAMAAPLIVILPIAIALRSPVGALVTLALTLLGGWMTGILEVQFGKPAPRSSFKGRRGGGGLVRGLLQFALVGVLGGIAAGTVLLLTTDLTSLLHAPGA